MVRTNDPWIEASTVWPMFPTFVWETRLKSEVTATIQTGVEDLLARLRPAEPMPPGASWQSDPALHGRPELGELVSCIHRMAGSILGFLKIGAAGIEITGCWANVNLPGAGHKMHSHPNNFLSGVYYVQVQDGADTINFHDPRVQTGIIRPPVTELTAENTDQVVVRVQAGALLMFPAWLPHSVDPNRSELERISISFNLMFPSYAETMSQPLWEGRVAERGRDGSRKTGDE
jgi:uncharacterized protein (TIGR02466 family)